MNKYKLLTSSSGRRGSGLFLIGVLLLAVAAADQFYRPFLGSYTMAVWTLGGLFTIVAILLRFTSSAPPGYFQIEEDGLTVHSGRREFWIGYEEIDTVTGGRISQHHSLKELSRRDRQSVKPYFNQTHIFITLHEDADACQEAPNKLPRYMLGTTQPGFLLPVTEEWLTVERAIDSARVAWLSRIKESHQEDHRSIVAQIWENDRDDEENEEDEDELFF